MRLENNSDLLNTTIIGLEQHSVELDKLEIDRERFASNLRSLSRSINLMRMTRTQDEPQWNSERALQRHAAIQNLHETFMQHEDLKTSYSRIWQIILKYLVCAPIRWAVSPSFAMISILTPYSLMDIF